jgi:hypothetical protein
MKVVKKKKEKMVMTDVDLMLLLPVVQGVMKIVQHQVQIIHANFLLVTKSVNKKVKIKI